MTAFKEHLKRCAEKVKNWPLWKRECIQSPISTDVSTADYKIGGGFGCHVRWFKPEEFDAWQGDGEAMFSVWGHQPRIPKVGETLLGNFQTTKIKFQFVEVEQCRDPADMFFGKVKPIAQGPI